MKVVLDTNVVVSAFLSPAGKPAAILRLVLQNNINVCHNTVILSEYEQVLYRPKFSERIHRAMIQRFFEIIYDIGICINTVPGYEILPDESDRVFYDTAKAAGAVLITGNKKHYPVKNFIQDPHEFLILYFSR